MVVSGTAILWNGEKQSTVGRVGMGVKGWGRNRSGQALRETDPDLGGEVCLRCGGRAAAEHIGFQAGSRLAASTSGLGPSARGYDDTRHAVLGHAPPPQHVHEKGHGDGHNDRQDVIRRARADQAYEGERAVR